MVNGGGLGQIGDDPRAEQRVLRTAGRCAPIAGRLDELVGVPDDQRDGVLATLTELEPAGTTLADQRAVPAQRCNGFRRPWTFWSASSRG